MNDTDHILLNVSGRTYETTYGILKKSNYFEKYFKDTPTFDKTQPIFINRSQNGFNNILSYLIDNRHKIPKKYLYEVDFYQIFYY